MNFLCIVFRIYKNGDREKLSSERLGPVSIQLEAGLLPPRDVFRPMDQLTDGSPSRAKISIPLGSSPSFIQAAWQLGITNYL